jgi:hypothetical protein
MRIVRNYQYVPFLYGIRGIEEYNILSLPCHRAVSEAMVYDKSTKTSFPIFPNSTKITIIFVITKLLYIQVIMSMLGSLNYHLNQIDELYVMQTLFFKYS